MLDKAPWPKIGCILLVHQNLDAARKKAFDYAAAQLSTPGTAASVLMQAGTHPDFSYLEPAGASQWITIDAIRDLITWALHKPVLSHYRVAIIAAAHALNIQAGNALLKTLEESNDQTLFILLTHQPALVLPTIRSRCYRILIPAGAVIPAEQATIIPLSTIIPATKPVIPAHPPSPRLWRGAAGIQDMQTDLHALVQGQSDPITLSQQWLAKQSLKAILDGLWAVLHGRVLQGQNVWGLVDKLLQAQKSLTEGARPNDSLLLGSLLIEYTAIMTA